MLGGAVWLVDPVLDGGFARSAAVELVGCRPRIVKEEQAEKRPSEREEEEADAKGNSVCFDYCGMVGHDSKNKDDRSKK